MERHIHFICRINRVSRKAFETVPVNIIVGLTCNNSKEGKILVLYANLIFTIKVPFDCSVCVIEDIINSAVNHLFILC